MNSRTKYTYEWQIKINWNYIWSPAPTAISMQSICARVRTIIIIIIIIIIILFIINVKVWGAVRRPCWGAPNSRMDVTGLETRRQFQNTDSRGCRDGTAWRPSLLPSQSLSQSYRLTILSGFGLPRMVCAATKRRSPVPLKTDIIRFSHLAPPPQF